MSPRPSGGQHALALCLPEAQGSSKMPLQPEGAIASLAGLDLPSSSRKSRDSDTRRFARDGGRNGDVRAPFGGLVRRQTRGAHGRRGSSAKHSPSAAAFSGPVAGGEAKGGPRGATETNSLPTTSSRFGILTEPRNGGNLRSGGEP
jgi:hypothetical protein